MGFWTSGHNLSQETLIFCYILCFFQQHSSNVLIPQKLKAKYTKNSWAIFKSTNRTKISPNHTVQSVCASYVNRQLQHNNVYYKSSNWLSNEKWHKTNTHGSTLQMSRLPALISCQLSESNQISVLHTELENQLYIHK